MPGTTYKSAGVDIDAADFFVGEIKRLVAAAWPEAAYEIGGFAGGGRIPAGAGRFTGSTDGAGTKIILAAMLGRFGGIGQDVVAMSAVDTYCDGFQPTHFWDALKVAHLDVALHLKIIESLIAGCKLAGCQLVGGETAEMPDLYADSWAVDLDGFVIGFPHASGRGAVEIGDKIYGWPSNGLGANGYSLARKVFKIKHSPAMVGVIRDRLNTPWVALGNATLADELLRPTPIWINAINQMVAAGVEFARHAHITSGGLPGNISRILPPHCKAVIDCTSWVRPPIFGLIQREGNVEFSEMARTFNNGVMMASVVSKTGAPLTHPDAFPIGEIATRNDHEPQVDLIGEFRDNAPY